MSAPIKKEKPRERELSPDEIRKLWLALDRAPIQRRSTKGMPRGEKGVGSEDIPLTRATALALTPARDRPLGLPAPGETSSLFLCARGTSHSL